MESHEKEQLKICFRSSHGHRAVATCFATSDGLVLADELYQIAESVCKKWLPREFDLSHNGCKLARDKSGIDLSRFGTVYVTKSHLVNDTQKKQDTPDQPELESIFSPSTVEYDEEKTDETTPPCCRICFGTENSPYGNNRLFRPCLCSGSLQYVHIGCLNEWRRNSSSSEVYLRCSTCNYAYNTQYSDMAKRLEVLSSDIGSLLISISIFLLLSLVVTHTLVFLGANESILRFIHYDSLHYRFLPFARKIVPGALCIGLTSFVARCCRTLQWLYRMRDIVGLEFLLTNHDFQAFGMMLLTYNNSDMVRLICSIGIVYFTYELILELKAHVKLLIQRFGEVILEVVPVED